jgi:hypothetical protein
LVEVVLKSKFCWQHELAFHVPWPIVIRSEAILVKSYGFNFYGDGEGYMINKI